MRQYETLLLLSPELNSDDRKGILDNLTGILSREDGSLLVADEWGMRDLAYAVRKQTRGYYIRLEYAAGGDTVAELERNIRITDGVLKFMTVKLADTFVPQEA
jgi:small subunit ribosomal protein S6